MPLPSVKYTELLCHLPLEGLLVPMSYNLLLVLVCAVHGFATRKLPENFNESKFIFASVSTTTFLWIVFLPAYFTAFYAHHKTALLASCLLINAVTTLTCLYFPKVYAIYFVTESDQKVMATMNTGWIRPGDSTAGVSTIGGRTRVFPMETSVAVSTVPVNDASSDVGQGNSLNIVPVE